MYGTPEDSDIIGVHVGIEMAVTGAKAHLFFFFKTLIEHNATQNTK